MKQLKELEKMEHPERVYVDIVQRSPEWHILRRGKITGTDYPKILYPSATRDYLMRRKAIERADGELSTLEPNPSFDMLRGLELEPIARKAYENKTLVDVLIAGFVDYVGNDERFIGWCGCSPDGLIGTDGMIEIKCPNDENFEARKNVPLNYMRQMQYNMWCTQRKWCDYVLFNTIHGMWTVRVLFDAEYATTIENKVAQAIWDIRINMEDFTANIPF
jgi:hypothetical protein